MRVSVITKIRQGMLVGAGRAQLANRMARDVDPPDAPYRAIPALVRCVMSVMPLGSHARLHARGFTLLELLVVMIIIGLLAGYVGPRYFSQIGKSEIKAAKAQIDALEKALDQYRLDTGHYPRQEQGIEALRARPMNDPKWDGPYLKKSVPLDPWGNPYVYQFPGTHGDFDLLSFGKDGRPGGDGENADIANW